MGKSRFSEDLLLSHCTAAHVARSAADCSLSPRRQVCLPANYLAPVPVAASARQRIGEMCDYSFHSYPWSAQLCSDYQLI